jgi:hypothetical protein
MAFFEDRLMMAMAKKVADMGMPTRAHGIGTPAHIWEKPMKIKARKHLKISLYKEKPI